MENSLASVFYSMHLSDASRCLLVSVTDDLFSRLIINDSVSVWVLPSHKNITIFINIYKFKICRKFGQEKVIGMTPK